MVFAINTYLEFYVCYANNHINQQQQTPLLIYLFLDQLHPKLIKYYTVDI